MKKHYLIITVFFVFISAGVFFARAESRNVEDYYYSLPPEYFYCEMAAKASRADREKWISKKNIPMGYILARSEGYPLEVALFLGEKGKPFLVVSRVCGQGCMCNFFHVLVPAADGGWSDVTQDLVPLSDIAGLPDVDFRYALPEQGTTIRIVEYPSKKTIAELVWTKKKFLFKKSR